MQIDATDYVGLPFKARGRDHAGVDCWGLVRLVYAEQMGIELPDNGGLYDSTEDADTLDRLIAEGKEAWQPVPLSEAVAGDVLVVRMRGQLMHVGLVVQRGLMLHTTEGCDATVERYTLNKWLLRIEGCYRYVQP